MLGTVVILWRRKKKGGRCKEIIKHTFLRQQHLTWNFCHVIVEMTFNFPCHHLTEVL